MNEPLHYGVKITYRTSPAKPGDEKEKKIQYIVKVGYREDGEGNLLCTLNREGFSLDGKRIYRLVDVLAEECMRELYPFVFRISRAGLMLSVENLEQIQRRWVKALPELRRTYAGEQADTYFNRVTKNLSSVENFRQAIKKDVFYYLFFMQEPAQDKEGALMRLPLVPGERAAVFTGRQTIRNINESDRIQMDYSGEYAPEIVRHRSRIKNGRLELKYIWDKEGAILRKVEGKSDLVTEKEREISFKITRL